MRFLLPEAVRSVIAQRLSAITLTTLSLLFVVAVAAIVQRADAEREVLVSQLDSGVSRVIEVRAGGSTPSLPHAFALSLTTLSSVDYVVAFGRASDTINPVTRQGPFPVRYLAGTAPGLSVPQCTSSDTRLAFVVDGDPNNQVRSSTPTALESPSGSQAVIANVTTLPLELRGRLTGALTRCPWPDQVASPALVIGYVVVESVEEVVPTSIALQSLVARMGQDLRIESAAELAQYRDVVGNEFSRQRRQGVGIAALSLVMLNLVVGTVTSVSRRTDFGRRRVLGASRLQLGLIVLLEGVLTGVLALIVGSLGIVTLHYGWHYWSDLTWLPNVVVMVVSSSAAGQIPVVVAAGYMDPIRALRVP